MSKLNKSIVAEFESAQITRELPKFSQGDTVVVNVKVKEAASACRPTKALSSPPRTPA
jgi:large subunit ribosomal protein L19